MPEIIKRKAQPNLFDQEKALQKTCWAWEAAGLADLYYFDETGFSLTPCVPYAWQPKCKATLGIPSAHSQRINVLGFMNRHSQSFFQTTTGRVTSDVVIDCFDQFAENHAERCGGEIKPCFVILDNASMHRSHAFKAKQDDWEAQGVFLHFLPPYSPELNLIEILWRKIKYSWLSLAAYKSMDTLKGELSKVLNGVGEKYCITFS